jgi:hypothetical protein
LRRGERDLFRLPFVFHGHRAEASSNQEDGFQSADPRSFQQPGGLSFQLLLVILSRTT